MSKNSKEAQDRAEASFTKKEQQAREGAKAFAEYEAQSKAAHDKTARLRLLRLAKEAADSKAEAEAKPEPKPAKKKKKG